MNSTKKVKLSKAQQEVIELMGDGWQLGRSVSVQGRVWLQKGGVGRGGETRTLSASTFHALWKAGLLVCVSETFPTEKYSLAVAKSRTSGTKA